MKKWICVMVLMVFVSGIGVLFFNPSEESRVPQYGIYWIKQNSFYAIREMEELSIGLDFFVVTPEKDEEVNRIEQVYFLDEEGNTIEILNKDYKLVKGKPGEQIGKKQYLERYILELESDIVESTVLTQVCYSYNNQEYKKNIGRIEIKVVECGDGLTALQNRIDWEEFTQPALDHAEYIFYNQTKKDIILHNILYGNSEIRAVLFEKYCVKPGEECDIESDISVKEVEGIPIIYYLKPIVQYSDESIIKETVFDNISKEAYYGDKDTIREYLYQQCRDNG